MSRGTVVGLTGGIASGKSAVARILKDMGIAVIDADQVARQIVEPGLPAWQDIADHFGPTVLNPDQAINRGELGRIVFSNPKARQQLNEITHPRIREEMHRQLHDVLRDKELVFLEIPLLIEGGGKYPTDEIWVVYTNEQNQLKRLQERNGLSYKEAMERIRSQMPLSEKVKRADRVICNNGTIADLERQVHELVNLLKQTISSKNLKPGAHKGEIDCGNHKK